LIPNHQFAPDFHLPDLEGAMHQLQSECGQITVINFWSAECPWVERADHALLAYLQDWGDAVALWSIASNANEPIDLLRRVADERGLPLLLHDADQRVADLYNAQTTPHLFVLDSSGIVRYQGAFDDVTFRQRTPTRGYLRQTVEALLAGQDPDPEQTSPYGCIIVRYGL
jgi:peroxiredoxin